MCVTGLPTCVLGVIAINCFGIKICFCHLFKPRRALYIRQSRYKLGESKPTEQAVIYSPFCLRFSDTESSLVGTKMEGQLIPSRALLTVFLRHHGLFRPVIASVNILYYDNYIHRLCLHLITYKKSYDLSKRNCLIKYILQK